MDKIGIVCYWLEGNELFEIVVYNQIGICCMCYVVFCVSGLFIYCERVILIDRKFEKFKLIFKK